MLVDKKWVIFHPLSVLEDFINNNLTHIKLRLIRMKKICLWTVFMTVFSWNNTAQAQDNSHYSEWMVASEMQRTPHPYNLNFSSSPQWSYQVGIELDAMLDVYLTYQNSSVLNYLKEYPQKMISSKGSISGYSYEAFNLDNVRPGHFLLRYYQLLPVDKEKTALTTLFMQLENQPRTTNGVWWHKEIYKNQVWLDGVFMGMPFYTLAAPILKVGQETSYYDDAVNQMTTTDEKTYDEATDLWKHAWSESSIFWADPVTGQSQHTWGRALGWYAMALVEVLDALPATYTRRQELLNVFRHVMASVVNYQDETSGVWYDVLDVDDPRNYLEATCSSMFAYALLKGVRMGYLDTSYRNAGIKAYRGIIKEFVKQNNDKTISLTKCCEVSGLGPETNRRRDGSFDYYMSENVRDNDPKGIGPFIWASLEMETLGYNVNNLNEDLPTGIDIPHLSGNTTHHYDRQQTWDGTSYTLDGLRIKPGTGQQHHLPKGVYIVNGRKEIRP